MTASSRDAHLLSGAYVLHALDADERAAVEAAMAGSEELRGELVGLSDTAVELGLAVRPVQPPAALRARVLAEIADAPQLPPRPRDEQPHAVQPGSRSPGPAERAAQRRWYRRPAVLAAAAAAAAVLFVGGGVGLGHVLVPGPSSQLPLASAPDVHRACADVTGGGTAVVYSSASLHESGIVLTDVAQPAAGRVLQVWRLSGGSATSLGFYSADDDCVLAPQALRPGERIAVTVEPAGGSAQPTTTPLVALSA